MRCAVKYLSLIFLSVCLVTSLFSQVNLSTRNKKALKQYEKAVSEYRVNNTAGAVEYLNKAVSYDNNFIEAWLLLGDAYTEINSINSAIESYEYALSIDSLYYIPVYYFLGNLYQSIYNFQKAGQYYGILDNNENITRDMALLLNTAIERNAFLLKEYSNPLPIVVENIGAPVNTTSDEYVNYLNSNSSYLMYTRRVLKENPGSGRRYDENLYYSVNNDSLWQPPMMINEKWMEGFNTGSVNLSADGRKMFLTGCYWPGSKGSCDLYVSEKTGNIWQTPIAVSSINSSGWESQPSISSDGKKLYFASKRAGGKGGSDIWMSVILNDGSWSPPVNLGDSINTTGDEMSPVIHADGRTLYFSSNGHMGIGGMDLFISRKDETGIWSNADNLGVPINTEDNEINIFTSLDGKTSWISSDREGGYGNYDIYRFNNPPEILPQKIAYISGKVIDKETLTPLNAKVEITNLENLNIVNSTVSDSVSGEFLIVLFPDIDYAFNISHPGYLFLSENINLNDTNADDYTVSKTFELIPVGSNKQLILNNIYFEFNKSNLLPSSKNELDKVVGVLNENPGSRIRITGHTDNKGNDDYNKKLSVERAKSVYNYLINNGVKASRLSFNGKGSTEPVSTNDTEKGRAANRRTEITFL